MQSDRKNPARIDVERDVPGRPDAMSDAFDATSTSSEQLAAEDLEETFGTGDLEAIDDIEPEATGELSAADLDQTGELDLDDESTQARPAVSLPPPPVARTSVTVSRPPPPIVAPVTVSRPPPPIARPSFAPPAPPPLASQPAKPLEDPAQAVEDCLARLERTADPDLRAGLYRKIAKILIEDLDDPEQAFEVLVTAFSEDVEDDETGDALERAAQATGRWGDLVRTANAWLSEPTLRAVPQKRAALSRRLASWYGERIGRADWALPYLQQVAEIAPDDLATLRLAARIHRRSGDAAHEEIALREALRVGQGTVRKELETELGDVLRVQGKAEPAIAAYRRALEIDPAYGPALDALRALLAERGLGEELATILERRLSMPAPPGASIPARLELASLRVEGGALDRAAQLYREVLAEDPANRKALVGLSDASRAQEDWRGLAEALVLRIEAAPTDRERVDLLVELATILEERFLARDEAIARLEEALAIDPNRVDALDALARNHAKLRRFHDLVEIHERRLGAVTGRARKAAVLVELGRVLSDDLGDHERAIDAYGRALELVPDLGEALEAVARLHALQGDATRAVELLRKVADRTKDADRKADLLLRAAILYRDELDAPSAARAHLREALDHAPDHVECLAAMRALVHDAGDARAEADLIERLVARIEATHERARLLAELGDLRAEALDDPEGALAAYERSFALDDGDDRVARILAERWADRGDYLRALPLLERAAQRAKGGRDREEARALHAALGRAYLEIGRPDRGAKALEIAHKLDPADVAISEALADAAYALEDWTGALRVYERLLLSLEEGDVDRRVKALHRIGVIRREQGQTRAALASFERALELDAEHRESLEALASIHAERGAWGEAIGWQRRIADATIDREALVAKLDEIAQLWLHRARDPRRAVEAWEEALVVRGDEIGLLHKMIPALHAIEGWDQLVDVLGRIVAIERDAVRRAKVRFTMGQLLRDKLDWPDQAIDAFEAALDDDPGALKAFEAIDKLHTARRAWKPLERAYRKMLHRVSGKGSTELEFTLWNGLGLIYRDRLGDDAAAAESFRMAARLRPGDVNVRRILAELHDRAGDVGQAAAELHEVLLREPTRAQAYRDLFRLYRRAGHADKAVSVAATLCFLGKADDEQRALVARHRPPGIPAFRGTLDAELFGRCLVHPDQDELLGKIFEMLAPSARALRITALRSAGRSNEPPPSTIQDRATTTSPIAKVFFAVSKVLGLPSPRLALVPRAEQPLVAVAAEPPLSIASAAHFEGRSPAELAFLTAHHVACHRGGEYVKALFPSTGELKTLLLAAVKLGKPDVPLPAELEDAIVMTARQLAQLLAPVQADALRLLVKRFLAAGGNADVKKWMQATELTALRAGFLLSGGDLQVAAGILSSGPALPWDLPLAEKLQSLVAWSVSEPHFVARKALGIAIA